MSGHAAKVARDTGLSLAFQAQLLAPAHPPWQLCKSEPRTPVSGHAFRRFEVMDTTYSALNPAFSPVAKGWAVVSCSRP